MSLFIATASRDHVVRTEWAMAFASQVPPVGRKRQATTLEDFTNVTDVRNVAVHVAGMENAEYIMFWDDDVVPHSRMALQLLVTTMDQNQNAICVGGVYPRRGNVPEPIVSQGPDSGLWWGWQDGSVHKVYMTGTGFTLMRLSYLAELDVPEQEMEDGSLVRQIFGQRPHYSDDFWLADLLAEKSEHDWLVHGGVVCDQVDIDGTRYQIKDAMQKVAVSV